MVIDKEKINNFLNTLTKDEIEDLNKKDQQDAEDCYKDFKKQFKNGNCFICNKPLKTFSADNPCLHWLLRENNKIKKKDIKKVLDKFSYFQVNSYLRWAANSDEFFKNINDLEDEKDGSKLIEITLKYKHIKWSISCSYGDYTGHVGKKANFPHYHFEMLLNGQVFIKFNDFHIPFKESDLFGLIMIKDFGAIESHGTGGTGMESLMNCKPEDLVKYSSFTKDESKADINISTIASFGKNGILVDDVFKIIEEAEKSGVSAARLLQERANSAVSFVSPHDSVPKKEKRSGRRKHKSK